ncbi:MAG: branched-chain amino acid aminotransferase, partial [Lentisphaerae bacterium]|nr:branched-chain amino acid aminotransferase [Lentisphaerota bacterium]
KMVAEVVRTCKENNTMNGYIRLIVTRGCGTLGLNPYTCDTPQIIIIADNIQLYPEELYQKGLKVITSGTLRNHPEALNPKIKSLNYLNNILAKIEAINSGVLEVIMLNHQGYVAEATGDNVFMVQGNDVITPPASAGALEGVTRNVVCMLAKENGFNVKEVNLSRYDLYNADEMFLTGTAAEIISVVEYDKRQIGNGKPGAVTEKLRNKFVEFANSTGEPIV